MRLMHHRIDSLLKTYDSFWRKELLSNVCYAHLKSVAVLLQRCGKYSDKVAVFVFPKKEPGEGSGTG